MFVQFEQITVGLKAMQEELQSPERADLWAHVRVSVPNTGFGTSGSYDPSNPDCKASNLPRTNFLEPVDGGIAKNGKQVSDKNGRVKEYLDLLKANGWPFMLNLYPYWEVQTLLPVGWRSHPTGRRVS